MRESSTQRKMNEQAREAMASVLLFDIADPRLREATVTGCKVSPDRGHCWVYYSAHAGQYAAMSKAFEKASGAIRSCLAKRLGWRVAPAVHFVLDDTVDDALRISAALDAEARTLHDINPDGIDGDEDAYKGEVR